MSDCIINPARSKGEPQLPAIGILSVNPADSTGFPSLVRRHSLVRHAIFHAHLQSNDLFFLAGPAVGAPMATICLEKLIALGARRILVYGWCGSLHPALVAGDLFIPTGGLSEEGTSAHYQGTTGNDDDILRLRLIDALTEAGSFSRPKQGRIWTTDAVYRETREKVERYGAQGILAVDMEYTALRSVAAFRQISLAAVMLVSDELFHQDWAPGMHLKRFRHRSRQVLECLCSLIQHGKIV
ncbi:MAG: nucleoside phosphorylase [Desulfobulbus sp.]|nr:nucleoside phosphorylase [Desulfobulbus sp.]